MDAEIFENIFLLAFNDHVVLGQFRQIGNNNILFLKGGNWNFYVKESVLCSMTAAQILQHISESGASRMVT